MHKYDENHCAAQCDVPAETIHDCTERTWHQQSKTSSMQKPVIAKYISYGAPSFAMLPHDSHQYVVPQGDAPADATIESLGKFWHNQALEMKQLAWASYEAYHAPTFSNPVAQHTASTLLASSWRVPTSLAARSIGSGPEIFNPLTSLPPRPPPRDVGSAEATPSSFQRTGSQRISVSMDAPPPFEESFARIGSISTDFARVSSAEDRAFARLLSGGVDYAHPMSLSQSPIIFPPSTSIRHFSNLNEPCTLAASIMHPSDSWPPATADAYPQQHWPQQHSPQPWQHPQQPAP